MVINSIIIQESPQLDIKELGVFLRLAILFERLGKDEISVEIDRLRELLKCTMGVTKRILYNLHSLDLISIEQIPSSTKIKIKLIKEEVEQNKMQQEVNHVESVENTFETIGKNEYFKVVYMKSHIKDTFENVIESFRLKFEEENDEYGRPWKYKTHQQLINRFTTYCRRWRQNELANTGKKRKNKRSSEERRQQLDRAILGIS